MTSMKFATHLLQFFHFDFFDPHDLGPPPPYVTTVQTQLVMEPSLSTALTVLAYVMTIKLAFDILATVLPLVLAFVSTSASLQARLHYMSTSRHLFLVCTMLGALFVFGILPCMTLPVQGLSQLGPTVFTLAAFILRGREGRFPEDTRFFCSYPLTYKWNTSIIHKILSFSGALQFTKSRIPCATEDGANIIVPMEFLLSYNAQTVLGRISRLFSFALTHGFRHFTQLSVIHCLKATTMSIVESTKTAGTSVTNRVLSSPGLQLSQAFDAVTNHTRNRNWVLLCSAIAVAMAICIVVIFRSHYVNGYLSYVVNAVGAANSKLVESLFYERDGLKGLLDMANPTPVSRKDTLQSEQSESDCLSRKLYSVLDYIGDKQRLLAQIRGHTFTLELGGARKLDVIKALIVQICDLESSLSASKAQNAALTDSVKTQREVRVSDRLTIRDLKHTAEHALRARDDARIETNIATQRADVLAAQNLELETTVKHLRIAVSRLAARQDQLEEAAEWAQFEKDVFGVNISATPIQSAVVPETSPSIEPRHLVRSRASTPITVLTDADDGLRALSSCLTTPASPSPAVPPETTPRALIASRLPRRALADITACTPNYVFKGPIKSHVTHSTRKALAEKENVSQSPIHA